MAYEADLPMSVSHVLRLPQSADMAQWETHEPADPPMTRGDLALFVVVVAGSVAVAVLTLGKAVANLAAFNVGGF